MVLRLIVYPASPAQIIGAAARYPESFASILSVCAASDADCVVIISRTGGKPHARGQGYLWVRRRKASIVRHRGGAREPWAVGA